MATGSLVGKQPPSYLSRGHLQLLQAPDGQQGEKGFPGGARGGGKLRSHS